MSDLDNNQSNNYENDDSKNIDESGTLNKTPQTNQNDSNLTQQNYTSVEPLQDNSINQNPQIPNASTYLEPNAYNYNYASNNQYNNNNNTNPNDYNNPNDYTSNNTNPNDYTSNNNNSSAYNAYNNYDGYNQNQYINAENTETTEASENNQYSFDFSQGNNQAAPLKKRKASTAIISIILILIIVPTFGFSIYSTFFKNDKTSTQAETEQGGNIHITEIENLDDGLPASDIYKKVSPSIVGIETYQKSAYGTVKDAEGSGVVMSSDGKIITNAHVAMNAETIKVTFLNEESYQAKLIGTDVKTDLAVVQLIDVPKDLVVPEFGDSQKLEIGERIVAIGNPGGLSYAGSITQGIISGMDRKVSDEVGFSLRAIQVDAAVNPGNSGGALINRFGQVVGITSSKLTGTFEGMGFALPMHEVSPIIDVLIKDGKITRAVIGITYQADKFIDTQTAKANNLKSGLVVYEVDEASDAYAQGLRPNDIIHQIDDNVLLSVEDIATAIDGKKPGDNVKLVVYRLTQSGNLNEMNLEIELMESES